MNEANPFVISQFTNPSGEVVFRVDGRLDGKRIRKNFSTRAEADAERRVLQVQRLQGEAGVRTAVTRLTDEQLHEASHETPLPGPSPPSPADPATPARAPRLAGAVPSDIPESMSATKGGSTPSFRTTLWSSTTTIAQPRIKTFLGSSLPPKERNLTDTTRP